MKTIFATDLDNTLIFSYKHCGNDDFCVEYIDGKPQSFITQKAKWLLSEVMATSKDLMLIPITSRSLEQYMRIKFPSQAVPEYAVTTNGALLLRKGVVDQSWRDESMELVNPWRKEICRMYGCLSSHHEIKSFRIVDDAYLYAVCVSHESASAVGVFYQNRTELTVAASGRKVYFFPPLLNKGEAVRRLIKKLNVNNSISAGDSIIDEPMLLTTNTAIIPNDYVWSAKEHGNFLRCPVDKRFSEFVLEQVINKTGNTKCCQPT